MYEGEYAYYYKNTFVAKGTVKELAELLNVSPKTIHTYTNESAQPRHRKVLPLHEKQNYVLADLEAIQAKRKEFGYKHKELAEALELNEKTYYTKIVGKHRFTDTEIEELEDLFFLDEGTLLLDEED